MHMTSALGGLKSKEGRINNGEAEGSTNKKKFDFVPSSCPLKCDSRGRMDVKNAENNWASDEITIPPKRTLCGKDPSLDHELYKGPASDG